MAGSTYSKISDLLCELALADDSSDRRYHAARLYALLIDQHNLAPLARELVADTTLLQAYGAIFLHPSEWLSQVYACGIEAAGISTSLTRVEQC
jgi:hypothetical protein